MSEYNRKWWDNMHGEDRNSHQGGHRNQWWGNQNGEGDKSHHSSHGNKWWEKDKNKEDGLRNTALCRRVRLERSGQRSGVSTMLYSRNIQRSSHHESNMDNPFSYWEGVIFVQKP